MSTREKDRWWYHCIDHYNVGIEAYIKGDKLGAIDEIEWAILNAEQSETANDAIVELLVDILASMHDDTFDSKYAQ